MNRIVSSDQIQIGNTTVGDNADILTGGPGEDILVGSGKTLEFDGSANVGSLAAQTDLLMYIF